MESQELTVEKNKLFESLTWWYSRLAKVSTITFVVFCLLAGLCIFSAVIGYMDWPPSIAGCIICLAAGSHDIIWCHKLAKANDAQVFITIYDKKRKIDKWTAITCALFIIAFIIWLVISRVDIKLVIFSGGLLLFSFFELFEDGPWSTKKDINRLRELLQQS